MMSETFSNKKYIFGDTAIYYTESPVEGRKGSSVVGLMAYPKDMEIDTKLLCAESLVQASITGDETIFDYTDGVTMCGRTSSIMRIEAQTESASGIETRLSDGEGNVYIHHLEYFPQSQTFGVWIEYKNCSEEARTLEKLSSFALSGLCAHGGKNNPAKLTLHRLTSAWSRECRLQSLPFSVLGLEASWAHHGVKCERWGQIGSMSNRGYYPFAAVEDGEAEICWAVTQEAPYSWQFDLFGEKESVTLASGLGDFEFAHWRKMIPAGGRFITHKAYFTVKKNLNAACNALLHRAQACLDLPECEKNMPVIFNEYCTTWANHDEQKILEILKAVKDFPIAYFVIDAGWYKPLDKGWGFAVGDWNENKSIFPHGLKAVVKKINTAGMKAGIWYEYETTGKDSEIYHKEEFHLTRGGKVITTTKRRFLDLRKEEVLSYLQEKVIKPLKENGFEYLKIDYNDAFSYCDGAESLGEGGRQAAEASIAFLDKLKTAKPDLIIENCASGGSRIEPYRMSKVSMCSFSDAHECPEIPVVAANVSRIVPAQQSQIWVVLRDTDDDKRTVYSLCASFFGRICLSGDVLNMSAEKKSLLIKGLEFYDSVKDIVRDGDIELIDNTVEFYRKQFGRQIYVKSYQNKKLVLVHNLLGEREIVVPVQGKLIQAYTTEHYCVREDALSVSMRECSAGAFLIEG